uniref:Uncharacterized protein n=1 Tax=Anguilla anguilla TaxID=7936 RepID=A0A0E9XUK1_ANGAN
MMVLTSNKPNQLSICPWCQLILFIDQLIHPHKNPVTVMIIINVYITHIIKIA